MACTEHPVHRALEVQGSSTTWRWLAGDQPDRGRTRLTVGRHRLIVYPGGREVGTGGGSVPGAPPGGAATDQVHRAVAGQDGDIHAQHPGPGIITAGMSHSAMSTSWTTSCAAHAVPQDTQRAAVHAAGQRVEGFGQRWASPTARRGAGTASVPPTPSTSARQRDGRRCSLTIRAAGRSATHSYDGAAITVPLVAAAAPGLTS